MVNLEQIHYHFTEVRHNSQCDETEFHILELHNLGILITTVYVFEYE